MLTNFHIVKAVVCREVMYGCESWTIKKSECQRINTLKLWCWRGLLRVPWMARRTNQSILKEINYEYSLEVLMLKLKLKLKLQYFGHWKRPWCWEKLRAGGGGGDRGWEYWMASSLNECEFDQTLGDSDGQGSLVCCSPWGCKESDVTEWLNEDNRSEWSDQSYTDIDCRDYLCQQLCKQGRKNYGRDL